MSDQGSALSALLDEAATRQKKDTIMVNLLEVLDPGYVDFGGCKINRVTGYLVMMEEGARDDQRENERRRAAR